MSSLSVLRVRHPPFCEPNRKSSLARCISSVYWATIAATSSLIFNSLPLPVFCSITYTVSLGLLSLPMNCPALSCTKSPPRNPTLHPSRNRTKFLYASRLRLVSCKECSMAVISAIVLSGTFVCLVSGAYCCLVLRNCGLNALPQCEQKFAVPSFPSPHLVQMSMYGVSTTRGLNCSKLLGIL